MTVQYRLGILRQCLEGHNPYRVREPDPAEAAVAVVLTDAPGGELRILLLKRVVRHGDPWSGQIALPGGRRDRGDDSLLATACRETREETGLDLSDAMLLGELDDVYPRKRALPDLFVRPFAFYIGGSPGVSLNHESELYLWVSESQLRESRVREVVQIHGRIVTLPGYRVGGHLVWGMTERIVEPFLELLHGLGD